MHWLSMSIQSRIETLAVAARPDRAGTGDPGGDRGDDVGRDVAGDRRGAVRSAAGRDAGPSALDRGRAACLEAVERVRALYDRVRATVGGGPWRRLSEQSARERQRDAVRIEALRLQVEQQAEQVEVLRRQFERLDGQVTPLAQDYETLAATLREFWNVTRRRGPERDHAPSSLMALRPLSGSASVVCGDLDVPRGAAGSFPSFRTPLCLSAGRQIAPPSDPPGAAVHIVAEPHITPRDLHQLPPAIGNEIVGDAVIRCSAKPAQSFPVATRPPRPPHRPQAPPV